MKYGLIGEKLGHSFSAEIHPKLFGYEYELKEIPREELDGFLKAKNFLAINVTIPYKEAVIPYLDKISETAKKIGAVNTVINRDGRLCGYNTDFGGMKALCEKAGISLKGKKVLILGSGGTSKTAKAVAQDGGCREVYRVSRSGNNGLISYEDARTLHSDAEIIINTTPCGMYPNIGESAVDIDDFPSLCGVVDAIFNPLRSSLVCAARDKGIPAVGGLYMLVAQAALAAEKFVDRKVEDGRTDEIYKELFSKKQNLVLVGMPGCGKSTLGKRLADELGFEFIDSDTEITRREGRTIPEIFERDKEAGFRDIESAVIKDISAKQGAVIATGGGAVLRKENTDLLKENGRIYFIDRPLEHLVTTDDRPLSSNRRDLERRFRERYDIYCDCCDKQIRTVYNIEENVRRIKEDFCNEATCD